MKPLFAIFRIYPVTEETTLVGVYTKLSTAKLVASAIITERSVISCRERSEIEKEYAVERIKTNPHTELLIGKSLWQICVPLDPSSGEPPLAVKIFPSDHYEGDYFQPDQKRNDLLGICWASSQSKALEIAEINRQVFVETHGETKPITFRVFDPIG
jgi:hypothetical protein